jgi:hypothetical protein
VRKRNVLREKKKCPPWEKELYSVREETLFKKTGTVKIFHQLRPSLFEDTPLSIEEDALLQSRRGLSRGKNMPLLGQERHILERYL